MAKDLRKLIRTAEQQGWRVKPKKAGFQFFAPDGNTIVTAHNTPSDHRAMKNLLSLLQRGGLRT